MNRLRLVICIFSVIFAPTAAFLQSEPTVLPFRTIGNLMVVQGEIDGQPGNLVIDTGIPKMLINKRIFKELELFNTGASDGFQSFGNVTQFYGTALVRLQLQDLSIKTDAEVIDLQFVERAKRMDIIGIVGIGIFRKYELEIDYFSQEIRLYNLDKNGDRLWQQPGSKPTLMFRLELKGHLACITGYLRGQPLTLGLDTGAEANVLPLTFYEEFKDQFIEEGYLKVQDLNGKITRAHAAQLAGLQIGAMEAPPMITVFKPYKVKNGGFDGKKVDGLLGFEFFRHFLTTINIKKKVVSLWQLEKPGNPTLAIIDRSKIEQQGK